MSISIYYNLNIIVLLYFFPLISSKLKKKKKMFFSMTTEIFHLADIFFSQNQFSGHGGHFIGVLKH